MKHQLSRVVVLLTGIALAQCVYAGASKVNVCHIPPDNPDNFHTITISSKALNAHLSHGDLVGRCSEYADQLCDDGNACTIDLFDEVTETCMTDHPPVDCADSDLCTIDSCDPEAGCLYAPIVCEDIDACTINACFEGECLASPIACGDFELCDADFGCYDPCGGISCDPVDVCHQPGSCVFPGECAPGLPQPDGTACDDGDSSTVEDQCIAGVCAGSASCESFDVTITPYADSQYTSTTITVTWSSTVPSTSQVKYSNSDGTWFTTVDTNLVTNHSVLVTGLTPFRIYEVTTISENDCGIVVESEMQLWRTLR